MHRVVIDTNVFVAAAFNPGSSAARLFEQITSGRLQMVWNQATRRETERVLRRIPRLDWQAFAGLFRADWEYRDETGPDAFLAVPDPDDRKFAALASAADAVLVTNDAHLLGAGDAGGFEAISPRRFLERQAASR